MTIAMSDGSSYENQLDMLFAKDMPSREETNRQQEEIYQAKKKDMELLMPPDMRGPPPPPAPTENDQLSDRPIKDQNDPYTWDMGRSMDRTGPAMVPKQTPKFHEIMDQMDYLIDPSAIPANARPTAGELAPGLIQPSKEQAPPTEVKSEPSPYGETYDKFVQHLEKATEFLNPSFIPTAEQFRDAPWKEKLGFIIGTSLMLAGPGQGKKAPGMPEAPALNKDPLSFWKEGLDTYEKIEFEKGIRSKLETDQVNADLRNKMGEIQGSKEDWQKANPEGLKNWSPEEDTLLAKSVQDGKTVKEIANAAGRSQAAIRGRLKALKNADTKFNNEVRTNLGDTEVSGESGVSPAETPAETANVNKPLFSKEFEAFLEARQNNPNRNPFSNMTPEEAEQARTNFEKDLIGKYGSKTKMFENMTPAEFKQHGQYTDVMYDTVEPSRSIDRTKLPKVDTELTGKSGIGTPNTLPGDAANLNKNLQYDSPEAQVVAEKMWKNLGVALEKGIPPISPVLEAKMNPVGKKALKQFETEMDFKYKDENRGWISKLSDEEVSKYKRLINRSVFRNENHIKNKIDRMLTPPEPDK